MSIASKINKLGRKLGKRAENRILNSELGKKYKKAKAIAKMIALMIQMLFAVLSFIIANLIWILIVVAIVLLVTFFISLFASRADQQKYYKNTSLSNDQTQNIKNIFGGVYFENYSDKSLYYVVEPLTEEKVNNIKGYLSYGDTILDKIKKNVQKGILNQSTEEIYNADASYTGITKIIDENGEEKEVYQLIQSGSKEHYENYSDIHDIDALEDSLKLSFSTLSILNEQLNEGYAYPAQFTKPVYASCVVDNDFSYGEEADGTGIRGCELLVDKMDDAASSKYEKTYTDGEPDNDGYYSSTDGEINNLSSYGLGSIALYETYIQPSRITNNNINYIRYQNPVWQPNNGEPYWIYVGSGSDTPVLRDEIAKLQEYFESSNEGLKYATEYNNNKFTEVANEITNKNYEGGSEYYEGRGSNCPVDNPPTEETIVHAITSAITPFGKVYFDTMQEWTTIGDANAENTFYTKKIVGVESNKYNDWEQISHSNEINNRSGQRGSSNSSSYSETVKQIDEYKLILPNDIKNFNEDYIKLFIGDSNWGTNNYLDKESEITIYVEQELTITEHPEEETEHIIGTESIQTTYNWDHVYKEYGYKYYIRYKGVNIKGNLVNNSIDVKNMESRKINDALSLINSNVNINREYYLFENYQTMSGDLQYYLVQHTNTRNETVGDEYINKYIELYESFIPVETADMATMREDDTDNYYCRLADTNEIDLNEIKKEEDSSKNCVIGSKSTGRGGGTIKYSCTADAKYTVKDKNGNEIKYIQLPNLDGTCKFDDSEEYEKVYYDADNKILIPEDQHMASQMDDEGKSTRTLYDANNDYLFLSNKTDEELEKYAADIGYKERKLDGTFSLADLTAFDLEMIKIKDESEQNDFNYFYEKNKAFFQKIAGKNRVDKKLVASIVWCLKDQTNSGITKNTKLEKEPNIDLKFDVRNLKGVIYVKDGKITEVWNEGDYKTNTEKQIGFIAAKLSQGLNRFYSDKALKSNLTMAIAHVIYDHDDSMKENLSDLDFKKDAVFAAINSYCEDYYYSEEDVINKINDLAWVHYLCEVLNNKSYYEDKGYNYNDKYSADVIINILKLLNGKYICTIPQDALVWDLWIVTPKTYTMQFNTSEFTDELYVIIDEEGNITNEKYMQILVEQAYYRLTKKDEHGKADYAGLTNGYENIYVNGIWTDDSVLAVKEKEPDIADRVYKNISDNEVTRILKAAWSINSDSDTYNSAFYGSESFAKSDYTSLYGNKTNQTYLGYGYKDIFGEDAILQYPLKSDNKIIKHFGNNLIEGRITRSDSIIYESTSNEVENVYSIANGKVKSVSQDEKGFYHVTIDSEFEEGTMPYNLISITYEGLNDVNVSKGDEIDVSDEDSSIGVINPNGQLRVCASVYDGEFDYSTLISSYMLEQRIKFLMAMGGGTAIYLSVEIDPESQAIWDRIDGISGLAGAAGNCTRYVHYLIHENNGNDGFDGDGKQMATNAIATGNYHSWGGEYTEIKKGSVISFDMGTSHGHVAYVEEVKGSGDNMEILVSDGNVNPGRYYGENAFDYGTIVHRWVKGDTIGNMYKGVAEIAVPN